MDVVNLADKLSQFTEAWSPKIVGDVNDMQVKVVKLRGEFVWHHHEVEDELFLVVAGRLRMRLRAGDREVGPGELIIVPRGVETLSGGPHRRGPRHSPRTQGDAQHRQRHRRSDRRRSRTAVARPRHP